jgi:hypothetical protein
MSGVLKLTPPPDTDVNYSSAIGEFVIGLSPIEGWVPPLTPDDERDGYDPGLNRLYDSIQSRVGGITLSLMELELHNIVEEFCIRSTYFRELVYWQMQVGVDRVELSPFSAYMVTVWVIESHGLLRYHVETPATLVDHQPPTATRTGEAWLVLRPRNFDAIKYGSVHELFTTWFEVMLDGVLFRLFGMPAKPWSSPQLAQYHGARFRQGLNRARDIAERLHSHQQSPRRAFPYFARGRRKN